MINTNIIGRVIYVTTQGRRMGRLSASGAALLGEGQRCAGHFRTCSVFSGLGRDHQSLVISTWLPGLVSSAEPEVQQMSSEHLESSASSLSSKAWPLCWVQRSVDPLILLLLHSGTFWKVV